MNNVIKNLRVDQSIRAIERYIEFAQEQGIARVSALDELIYYFINPNTINLLQLNQDAPSIIELKEICDAKDPTTHSNFFMALTTLCHDCFEYQQTDYVIKENFSPARIFAIFHHELLKLPEEPMILEINLHQLAQYHPDQLIIILFCIKTFVPEMVISGNFTSRERELSALRMLIDTLAVTSTITYHHCNLEWMGPTEMEVFLSSVAKADRLVLDNSPLNVWSAEDFIKFCETVKANRMIRSLSLINTGLNKCCEDSTKFDSILELISLPQLSELNLHRNGLSDLPQTCLNRLEKAVSRRGDTAIGLDFVFSNKGTSSNSGLFAPFTAEWDKLLDEFFEFHP